MSNIPQMICQLFQEWSICFSRRVWPRFQVLLLSAILCSGRHTICGFLKVAGCLAPGHWSSYHRVLSLRHWSTWSLARTLAKFVIDRFVPEGVIRIHGDDTVTEHPGRTVYGKGCHRDAVRSSGSHLARRWGHKWVALGIEVRLPFVNRPWVLPILCALYLPREEAKRLGRPHKTCLDLMRQLVCVLLRWFPERQFALAGDGGYGTHDLARFASRRAGQLTIVSKFYPDANLYALPPERKPGTNGRPRVKGRKCPSPRDAVARSRNHFRLSVSWYGGSSRIVEVVTQIAYWYKAGQGLVPVRWVFVRDLTGTHRDEYLFSTNLQLSAQEIIRIYTGRWNLEVTFEEVRAYVGVETTRGRCRQTILRAEPCLFGLYTLVALWFAEVVKHEPDLKPLTPWTGKVKHYLTFSDAITIVRRHIWRYWVFESPQYLQVFQKLSTGEKHLILQAVTHSTA